MTNFLSQGNSTPATDFLSKPLEVKKVEEVMLKEEVKVEEVMPKEERIVLIDTKEPEKTQQQPQPF